MIQGSYSNGNTNPNKFSHRPLFSKCARRLESFHNPAGLNQANLNHILYQKKFRPGTKKKKRSKRPEQKSRRPKSLPPVRKQLEPFSKKSGFLAVSNNQKLAALTKGGIYPQKQKKRKRAAPERKKELEEDSSSSDVDEEGMEPDLSSFQKRALPLEPEISIDDYVGVRRQESIKEESTDSLIDIQWQLPKTQIQKNRKKFKKRRRVLSSEKHFSLPKIASPARSMAKILQSKIPIVKNMSKFKKNKLGILDQFGRENNQFKKLKARLDRESLVKAPRIDSGMKWRKEGYEFISLQEMIMDELGNNAVKMVSQNLVANRELPMLQ